MENTTRFLGWVAMTVFLAAPLPADTNAAPAAAPAPQTDPFVKKNASDPTVAAGPQSNLVFTYEFYRLGQTDGAKLLQDEATDQQRYDHLRDLVKQGKATLDALMCGAVSNGNQVVTEQTDQFVYPIAYGRYDAGKEPRATDFKRRQLGNRLVLKAQAISGNEGCDVSMFPEQTRLCGFVDRLTWFAGSSFTAPQPVFETHLVNTKPPIIPFDQIRLISTWSPAPEDSSPLKKSPPQEPAKEPEMGLTFAHISRVQYDAGAAPGEKFSGFNLEMTAYSMERDQALRILSQPQQPGLAYEAVQALLKANQAKLEHISAVRAQVGLKISCSENFEDIYSTGDDEWTDQDVGFKAEVRADLIGNGKIVALDVSQFQFLKDLGPLQGEGLASTLAASQPIFRLQSVVTNVNAAPGEHALLGTISLPGDTGLPGSKDDGRVWLAFVQATPVNP